jgi:hypothetical protein
VDELERDEERIHRLGSWEVPSRYNREGKSDTEGNRERETQTERRRELSDEEEDDSSSSRHPASSSEMRNQFYNTLPLPPQSTA